MASLTKAAQTEIERPTQYVKGVSKLSVDPMTNILELVGNTNQLAVDEFVARFRLTTRCIRHTCCLPCTTTDE